MFGQFLTYGTTIIENIFSIVVGMSNKCVAHIALLSGRLPIGIVYPPSSGVSSVTPSSLIA